MRRDHWQNLSAAIVLNLRIINELLKSSKQKKTFKIQKKKYILAGISSFINTEKNQEILISMYGLQIIYIAQVLKPTFATFYFKQELNRIVQNFSRRKYIFKAHLFSNTTSAFDINFKLLNKIWLSDKFLFFLCCNSQIHFYLSYTRNCFFYSLYFSI